MASNGISSTFRDRTSEFRSLSNTLKKQQKSSSAGDGDGSLDPSSSSTKSSSSFRSEFNKKASRIGLGVHETQKKISRLANLAKKSTIFDDPLKEIQELTVLIKNDITSLNVAVSDLQTLQNMEIADGDYSEDRVVHGTAVCDDLKNKLMGTTKKFQDVLTARTENVKANENRRQIFSTNTARENPLRKQTKTVMEPPPWSSPSKSVGNAQPSESAGTGVQVGNQLRRRVAADGTPSQHMEGSMLQQQVVPQQESYTQNRAVALQSVESTITELSGIFTNLATMVAHQGELSIRIDDNMEETLSHVEGARGALLKHLNRISSNRLVVSGSRVVKCNVSESEIEPGGDSDDKEKEVHETVEVAESTNSSDSVIADDEKEKETSQLSSLESLNRFLDSTKAQVPDEDKGKVSQLEMLNKLLNKDVVEAKAEVTAESDNIEITSGSPLPGVKPQQLDELIMLPKETIDILKSQVFGFDTFFVTSQEPYEGGVLFKGNLLGSAAVSYEKIDKRLHETFGDQYKFFLLINPEDEKPVTVVVPRKTLRPETTAVLEWFTAGAFGLVSVFTLLLRNTPTLQSNLLSVFDNPNLLKDGFSGALVTALILGVHENQPPFNRLFFWWQITRILNIVPNRESLLKIAAAGPLAGYSLGLVLLLLGFYLPPTDGIGIIVDASVFHESFLAGGIAKLLLGDVLKEGATLSVNPLVIWAWAGLLINAINSIPAGELDGGRISFALWGRKAASRFTAASIVLLGLSSLLDDVAFYWVVLIFFLQRGPIAPLAEEISDPDSNFLSKQMVAEKISELERCLSELQDILIALEAAESRNAELTHAEIFSNSLQEALSQRDMILKKCAQIMAILINTPLLIVWLVAVYVAGTAAFTVVDNEDDVRDVLENLKDHAAWKEFEMHLSYAKQNKGSKKAKTSETTSGLAHGSLNLNEEVDDSGEEVREVRSIGLGRAKKKSTSSSRYEPSSVAGGGLLDLVTYKWKSLTSASWGEKKEQQESYIQLKNMEFDIHEAVRRESAELKREELALQHQTLELKLRNKREKDLMFYNSRIDETLPLVQQHKLMEMKQEIK
ncbi:probable zinc metalloprotease EGY2, chloroplastic isoform X1 [Tanacetum coccineum]